MSIAFAIVFMVLGVALVLSAWTTYAMYTLAPWPLLAGLTCIAIASWLYFW